MSSLKTLVAIFAVLMALLMKKGILKIPVDDLKKDFKKLQEDSNRNSSGGGQSSSYFLDSKQDKEVLSLTAMNKENCKSAIKLSKTFANESTFTTQGLIKSQLDTRLKECGVNPDSYKNLVSVCSEELAGMVKSGKYPYGVETLIKDIGIKTS